MDLNIYKNNAFQFWHDFFQTISQRIIDAYIHDTHVFKEENDLIVWFDAINFSISCVWHKFEIMG